jgi:soluble lytic murein transglycosylase-like protein
MPRHAVATLLAAALVAALPGLAQARPSDLAGHDVEAQRANPKIAEANRLCHLISDAAGAHGLPPEFLARLIWKESRFDVKAVSPKGAQGVAQFMPGTAKIRGLADPFDPEQAIPASAAYLAELRARFGNLGLAAAAYNSGENRVERYLARRSGLPGETLDYVHSITFRPASWFREDRARELEPRPLDAALPFHAACRRLPVVPTRAVLYAGGEWKPWGVQVAGNVSRGRAMRQYARVQARYGRIIGEREPMVVRARAGLGKKRLWSVRIGTGSRGEATRLCARLKAAGAPCLVRRN